MSKKKLTAAERFANLVKKQEQDGSLQVDGAKLELSEQIFQAMEARQVSEAELSRRLGVSRAYVNKILQGATNFTIETLVKIGIALGAEFKFKFEFESIDNTEEAIHLGATYRESKNVPKHDLDEVLEEMRQNEKIGV